MNRSFLYIIPLVFASLGASHRSRNFIVQAGNQQLARTVAQQAEVLRDQLAQQWLGHKLRPWRDKCPIRVRAQPNLPAGGETSFVFRGKEPGQWQMKIWGSRQRVLDSVLPHEITHTVFATHFGQPLPRWADEGACTTVEAASERKKHEQNLIGFLRSNQGIPFARMFALRQYPRNILPLYAQGYSLSRFLIERGGKRQFVKFVEAGLKNERWGAAVKQYYSYSDLSDLQLQWNRWVARGSPSLKRSIKPTPAQDLATRSRNSRVRLVAGTKKVGAKATGNYYLRVTGVGKSK